MGAAQIMVMQLLARQQVPLKRDVVLIAVADEEIDNTGVRYLLENHWDALRCGDVINEGGIAVYDLFFPGQTAYSISVGEKGVLWLKMIASGMPGHGSTPRPDEAPQRLYRALERLQERDPALSFQPSFLEALARAGAHQGGFAGWIMQHPFWTKRLLAKRIAANPISKAALTDTVHLTGFGGAISPNVIPGEAWATLDCRLLPGTSPEALLAELVARVDDPKVRFEVLSQDAAAVSLWEGEEVFEALAKHAVATLSDAVAIPVVSIGFTDSVFFRRRGARAYGLAPFRVDVESLQTMHGDGERLEAKELLRGVQILYGVVTEVAMDPVPN
jgi:acetylornithine deacetylase/succinyl-diaminopimelate desuccinylase-like protein